MQFGDDECRARLAAAPVARLGTLGPDGAPHLVPITFALEADELVFAIDHKPKTTTELARLRNLRRDPRVTVLADQYRDDWSELWWVRVDGVARELEGASRDHAVENLVARYAQYRDTRPDGPVVGIRITRWTGWSGSRPG
jgi:PPOX class probable F420-dependent enzyme